MFLLNWLWTQINNNIWSDERSALKRCSGTNERNSSKMEIVNADFTVQECFYYNDCEYGLMIAFIIRLLWTVCVDRLGHDQVVLIVDSLFIITEFGCCPCLGIRTIFFYCVEYYVYWNTWVVVDWLFLSLRLREEQKPNHNWIKQKLFLIIIGYSL